jgi:hypothetical protein
MEDVPRIVDFVPRRLLVIFGWFVLGVLMIAALLALYHEVPRWSAGTTDGMIAALDLDSEGSIAAWFSVMTLAAAALVALVIYSVRRRTPNDYHGRYRVWWWAAACWMLMSLDEGSSLHEGFKELMTQVAGTRIFGDGSVWWIIAYVLVLGTIGIRVLLDMRPSRLSATCFVATAVAYVVAVVAQLEQIPQLTATQVIMIEEGAEMLGNLLLLTTMTVHARYVILEASGEIKVVERKKRQRKGRRAAATAAVEASDKSSAPSKRQKSSDMHSRVRKAKTAKAARQSVTAKSADTDTRIDEAHDPSEQRRLTKAERKALRRRRRAAEVDD